MFQHSCSEIGSVRKPVLIHFNIIEQSGDKALHTKKSWQSLIILLHTCVSIMLKCISMQNLIKIYHAVQVF